MKIVDVDNYKKYILWLIDCVKECNDLNEFKPGYFPSISKYTAFYSVIGEYFMYEQNEENNRITHMNICSLLTNEYLSAYNKQILLEFLKKNCFYTGECTDVREALFDEVIETYLIETGIRTGFLLTINDMYKENLNVRNFYYINQKHIIDGIPLPQYLEKHLHNDL